LRIPVNRRYSVTRLLSLRHDASSFNCIGGTQSIDIISIPWKRYGTKEGNGRKRTITKQSRFTVFNVRSTRDVKTTAMQINYFFHFLDCSSHCQYFPTILRAGEMPSALFCLVPPLGEPITAMSRQNTRMQNTWRHERMAEPQSLIIPSTYWPPDKYGASWSVPVMLRECADSAFCNVLGMPLYSHRD